MSIRQPEKFDHPARPARHPWAFTLIELLVVVAIIAVLVSILLPSLSRAREQARQVVCGTTLNGFGKGLTLYFSENKDWIPGLNTTGSYWRSFNLGGVIELEDPKRSVQNFDWMTPILLFTESGLPAKRLERWIYIWEKYGCPTRQTVASAIFEDAEYFESSNYATSLPWKACSYLSPAPMHYWGPDTRNDVILTRNSRDLYALRMPGDWTVNTGTYRARLSRVGTPGRKIFAADGTRYLGKQPSPLDHDISHAADFYGAFTSAGAWWSGSRAYGVREGSETYGNGPANAGSSPNPNEGAVLPLSYRHGGSRSSTSGDATRNTGRMNALYFDGSVLSIGDRESREITLWYPTGSTVNSGMEGEGMTKVPPGFVIP